MSIEQWVRPEVRMMAGYTPGEQPRGLSRLIKLNTNENPYPPPREVLDAVRASVDHRLRLYPEPSARSVREAAARAFGFEPERIVVGNGSDDLLTMILRTLVEPGETVAAPEPTYSLYAPLTAIQGGSYRTVPWQENGHLPVDALVATGAKVIFVVRPNSPTGHAVPLEAVRDLCSRAPGVVVLDEAYADFCRDDGLSLTREHANLVVTRSFSKSFSLAGLRIGLGLMDRALAEQMHKVRDSYNVDALAQSAAVAVLDHRALFEPLIRAICEQRERLRGALENRGFTVPKSEANFLLATVPGGRRDGNAWMRDLRDQGILVRYFGTIPELRDKLRISIGTPAQMDALLEVVDHLLAANDPRTDR